MAEVLLDNNVQTQIPPELRAGLGRIVVAVNAADTERYMTGFIKLREPVLGAVHSLKLPREASVERRRADPGSKVEDQVISFEILAARFSAKKRIPYLCIDTKFSNDGIELAASVRGLRTESNNFLNDVRNNKKLDEKHKRRLEEMQRERRAITFLMHHMVDPNELEDAVGVSSKWYDPIAVVSSSKQKKETNARYGLHHRDLTRSMSRMAMDAGITHLTAAASDADFIRDVLSDHPRYEDLVISGTGAVLSQDDIGEHDAPSYIGETRHAVDFFVLGRAVLFYDDPEKRLLEYAQAVVS